MVAVVVVVGVREICRTKTETEERSCLEIKFPCARICAKWEVSGSDAVAPATPGE